MFQRDNLDIIVEMSKNKTKFFSPSKEGIYYQHFDQDEPNILFDGSILTYDLDIDHGGNYNLAILDHQGKLHFYRFDGKTWYNSEIHQFNLVTDEVKYLQIKCTFEHVFITLCERAQLTSNRWDIVSFLFNGQSWKKSTISTLYLNHPIIPYRLIKDPKQNLYMIYLTNSNIVFNLNLIALNHKTRIWSNHVFISNCLYIKTFHMDTIADKNAGIHLVWTDKYKKQFCIKYIFISSIKDENIKPTNIMLYDESIYWNHLSLSKNAIHCYGITENSVYHTYKSLQGPHSISKWTPCNILEYTLDHLFIFKSASVIGKPLANYYLSSDKSDFNPIEMDEINNYENVLDNPYHSSSQYYASSYKPSGPPEDSRGDGISQNQETLKLKADLFKINQKMDATQNLFNSLQSEIIHLKQEIKNMNDQNMRYIQLINESRNKYKEIYDSTVKLNNSFEDTATVAQFSELTQKYEILFQHFSKMKEAIHLCKTENQELKDYLENLKNESLLKKFFR
jgi:hypothetical protein